MLIDFVQHQCQQFAELAAHIQAQPAAYIQFDSVSDFYKAEWLNDFPTGMTWAASGLDDGAAHFYTIIEYRNHYLSISCLQQVEICCGIRAE